MKAYIYCNGCEQREMDSQLLLRILEKNNVKIVREPDEAELILIIACAVSHEHINETRTRLDTICKDLRPDQKVLM